MTSTPFRILALIPARAGSRGLRDKNVQPFLGSTLLERAVTLALATCARGEAWSVVVSTDSPTYAALARAAGAEVPFLRPRRLATGRARLVDVVLHALTTLERRGRTFDLVVLLSATTPLTTAADVRRVVRTYRAGQGESVVTLAHTRVAESWRFGLDPTGRLQGAPGRRVTRRQESPERFVLNGALYAASPTWLRRHEQFAVAGHTRGVIMPRERCLDVEDALDLEVAKLYAQRAARV